MSSSRRGHANIVCIVPISTDDPRRESSARFPHSTQPAAALPAAQQHEAASHRIIQCRQRYDLCTSYVHHADTHRYRSSRMTLSRTDSCRSASMQRALAQGLFTQDCANSSNRYPKYDDNVCSKLFCPRSRTTSEVVRRALGLYVQ